MDFASSHVYAYDHSDEECVSDEELDHGMSASDSGSDDEYAALALGGTVRPASSFEADSRSRDRSAGGFLGSLFGGRGRNRGGGGAPPPPPAVKKSKKKSHWRMKRSEQSDSAGAPSVPERGKRYRRADTNVVSVKFSQLIAPSNMHTGDATYCAQCDAVLSHLSKMMKDAEQQVWKCEFCGATNPVDLDEEELPRDDDVTFMLQPAPCTAASGKSGLDQSLVVFCVDTSGSMCVTTEVPGRVRLRGSERLDALQSLNDTHEDQFLPGQRRNVTYVSRLQGVQAAVDHQLEEMTKDAPNRRVALITFSNDVLMVGDGSADPVTVAGDKLNDQEKLKQIGAEFALPKTVKETRKALGDKLFDLEERGGTALGPALTVAVSMACQVPGSKVIICTDGMANVGLGSLEGVDDSEEKRTKTEEFYTAISDMAVDKGVSVSVISIKGTDCRLVELGKVADVTGGQVNIVDPLKLTQEFGTILSDPIIATNVQAILITHAGLYIRDEDNEADQSQSRAVRSVGNVTKETEITFEFGVKKHQAQQQGGDAGGEAGTSSGAGSSSQQQQIPAAGDSPTELPFQVQITYTDLDGAQALRLLTKTKPVTHDRAIAEKQINLGVLGAHTAQRSAALAQKGLYTKSRLNAHMQQRLVSRWTRDAEPEQRHKYVNFVSNIAPLANMLGQQQQLEIRRFGRTRSASRSRSRSRSRSGSRSRSRSRSRSPDRGSRGRFQRRSRSRTRSRSSETRRSRSRSAHRRTRRSRSRSRDRRRSRSRSKDGFRSRRTRRGPVDSVCSKLEKVRTGTNRTYSDDEDDSEDDMMDTMVVPGRAGPPAAPPLPVAAAPGASASAGAVESDGKDAKKKKKFKLSASQVRRERKTETTDESAKVVYQMKQAKSSAFL